MDATAKSATVRVADKKPAPLQVTIEDAREALEETCCFLDRGPIGLPKGF